MLGGSSLPGEWRGAVTGCACPVPGGVQGQVGWGPEKPCLVLNVEVDGPACVGEVGDS